MTLLWGGRLADGAPADVRIDPAAGVIREVAPGLRPGPGEDTRDCRGMVVLPAPVEPHAHLDKAGTWALAPNPTADLRGAVEAWATRLQGRSPDEILATAWPALEDLVAHGATAVRTHVNLGPGSGLAPLRALVALRDEARRAGLADVQVVALVSVPLSGPEGTANRDLLARALDEGADLAGGAPHVDADPDAAADAVLAAADAAGAGVDLHTDETLDPAARGLSHLARRVRERGWAPGRATASHCVSLGVLDADEQDAVAAEVAAAGLSVIALPQTNLYLQARGRHVAPPRGLTAVRALLAAGVDVAAGGDNVRDPFCAVGRADPLETAALMVMAAHLDPTEAWTAVTASGRAALGLPPVAVVAGAPAELLCVEGVDLVDALARAGERRLVVHRGRLVAEVEVSRRLVPRGVGPPLSAVPDPQEDR